MGTRATIKFEDEYDEVFIYRGHDGFPQNILADLEETIKICEGRWSGSEMGQLISFFLGMHFEPKRRIQPYELTPCLHGDESFTYLVHWNKDKRIWQAFVNE